MEKEYKIAEILFGKFDSLKYWGDIPRKTSFTSFLAHLSEKEYSRLMRENGIINPPRKEDL